MGNSKSRSIIVYDSNQQSIYNKQVYNQKQITNNVKPENQIKIPDIDVKIQTVNNINENSEITTNLFKNKFVPNDKLYQKYNSCIEEIKMIKQLEKKLDKIKKEKILYEEQSNIQPNGDLMKIVDITNARIELVKIMDEESKIKKKLQQLNDTNIEVLNEWYEYNKTIINLINENNLSDVLSVANLYCTTNLKALITQLINNTLFVKDADEMYKKIAKIGTYINLNHLISDQKINKEKLQIAMINYNMLLNTFEPPEKNYDNLNETITMDNYKLPNIDNQITTPQLIVNLPENINNLIDNIGNPKQTDLLDFKKD